MASKPSPEAIFGRAIEISDADEQLAYLDQACGEDEKLRAQVEALLTSHAEAGDFLEGPPVDPDVTLETPTVELAGTMIGRYKLLERIGEGGMATVYMAEQKRPMRRRVALKIIKLGMDTKQVIGRFEAERQALAMMDHPNIAKVFDAGTTETGRPYFVMELVRGVPITEFCDSNHLTPQERLELFISVCQAVQHAHQKGIIHRDIKPSNIMVTLHDGVPVVKVIDFGIAKAVNQQLTEKTVFTRYSQMIGTPEYMSPEQAEMSGLDIDTRTDVFSLGVLLYELLTGTTPFDSEYLLSKGYGEMQRIIREEEPTRPSTKLSTMGEALTDVAKRRHTSPETLRKQIRSDLDWIVMKTLEKDRQRRYESVSELAAEIRRHLNHEPVLAGRPSRIYRMKKFLLRNKTKVYAGSAVAVLIVAIVVVLMMYLQSANRVKETQSLEHEGILSKAQEFRSNGQFQEALMTVEPILDSKHVGPEAHLLHARLVMELQGPADALEELQELLNEPDEIACQAHFLLARTYLESDSDDSRIAEQYQQQAKEHQQKGEQLFSESAEAYFNRAMLTGTVNKTLECLNKALDLDPSHFPSRKARALAHYAIGDFRNMERDAVVMTGMRNWDPLGYSLMAIALREAKDCDEAISYHNKAIELAPNDPEFYDQRCQTYMRMASFEKALSDARTSMRLHPDGGIYHFHCFCALVGLGRYDEARAKYDSVMESDRMSPQHFLRLSTKHVSDMLDAGLSWHASGGYPKGCQAFAQMQDWDEVTRPLAKKARRVVVEAFHPTWSPDGTQLAYSRGVLGFSGIEVTNLNNNTRRLLTVPGQDPAWSPDGRYVAFSRNPQKLLLTDLTVERVATDPSFEDRELWLIKADGTEEPRFLAKGYWPCWSSDSKAIFFHSTVDDMLYLIGIDRNARPRTALGLTNKHPAVSPDGKYALSPRLWWSGSGPSRIVELSTNTVVASLKIPPVAGGGFVNWSPDGRELCIGGDGLWIYELDTRTASKVLDGYFGYCCWSPSNSNQFAVQPQVVHGNHHEIWVATLNPNLSTTESLGPGRTFEEHCRDEIDWTSRVIDIDPDDMLNRFFRAACYIPLQEYDKAMADFNEVVVRLLETENKWDVGWWWFQQNMPAFGQWGIDMYEAGEYKQAYTLLSGIDKVYRAARVDPNSAEIAYTAMSLHQLGRDSEAETALAELRKRLETDHRSDAMQWLCRAESIFADQSRDIGQVWECIERGKLDDAYQRLEGLQRDNDIPISVARATSILAKAYYERGRNGRYYLAAYGEAIRDYKMALRLDPNNARVSSDLAWLLVTCPEIELRDEKTAVENATTACESTDWGDHRYVGTLAAVHAQIGDFEEAVKWQKNAVDLSADGNEAEWQIVHESRLKLYGSGKSFPGSDPLNPCGGQMVACWDFEHVDGQFVKDSSGNGLDGKLVGDAHITDDQERGGHVLSLGGDVDWVDCGRDAKFDITSEITITCWFKVIRFDQTWQMVISKGDTAWRLLRAQNSNQLCVACAGVTLYESESRELFGKTDVHDNKWHHAVGVYDGMRACLYIDGVLDVSSEASGSINKNDWNVWIGANEETITNADWRSHLCFSGLIDDMCVYDYALTESDIQALYQDTKKPSEEK